MTNCLLMTDLKIENILLTRDENIKIIDFGLSNIYSPQSMLSTFCGSLYFAAPELLQAKKYTGPEVDIWSFGVVLFVLVAGRVPFDDTSMPALHAKIKAGVIDYPDHMSRGKSTEGEGIYWKRFGKRFVLECVDLLKTILVVDSSKRATIPQIAAHPWLNKRYEQPINNELPRREPLTVPVDMTVVEGMHGFGLGDPHDIKQRLEAIIETSEYQQAAKAIQEISQTYRIENIPQPQNKWRLKDNPPKKVIVASKDDPLSQPAMYEPLISIYYLVKERQEKNNKSLVHAHDITVPELSIAEKPLSIIMNSSEVSGSETSGSGKMATPLVESNPSSSRKNSPLASNHITFTSSTKVHDAENTGAIASTTAEPKSEKRASKRLSALFQSKRFSKDLKNTPTPDLPASGNRAASFENLAPIGTPSSNHASTGSSSTASRQQPILTASLSTPVRKTTFQQNVNNLGRRLTFKPKSSKPTSDSESKSTTRKPITTLEKQSETASTQNGTEPKSRMADRPSAPSKSPSISLSFDSHTARSAISRSMNSSPKTPKKSVEPSGIFS